MKAAAAQLHTHESQLVSNVENAVENAEYQSHFCLFGTERKCLMTGRSPRHSKVLSTISFGAGCRSRPGLNHGIVEEPEPRSFSPSAR